MFKLKTLIIGCFIFVVAKGKSGRVSFKESERKIYFRNVLQPFSSVILPEACIMFLKFDF